MKTKRIMMVLLMTGFLSSACLKTIAALFPIEFRAEYVDPQYGQGGKQRQPILPPNVFIEGYMLTFETGHPDYVLSIKDEDGDTVYTTVVYSTQTQVTLPATLSGSYEIELTMGYWIFTGWIDL